MEIQRGNAASVMGTAETLKDWDKYFLLLSQPLSQDRGFIFLNFEEVFEFGDPLAYFVAVNVIATLN